jgi:hypothetical protein
MDSEIDTLGLGILGEVMALGALTDDSEKGGDGGVTASDATEDADFVGGVAMIGDDPEVPGE